MFEALADLQPQQLLHGVKTLCLAHEEIYPGTNVVAKIRKYALGHHLKATAAEAFGVARKAANQFFRIMAWNTEKKRNGEAFTEKQLIFKNELIQKTLMIIGFSEFYNSDNEAAIRAHFMRIYGDLLEKENFKTMAGEQC